MWRFYYEVGAPADQFILNPGVVSGVLLGIMITTTVYLLNRNENR